MPGFQEPLTKALVASGTRTVTSNSGTLTVELCDSYEFIVQATLNSGTTPTMDVAIQITPDDGTTWFTAFRFAQITATSSRRLRIQPMQGRGEAGTEGAIADTGGALNANGIVTRKIRVLFTTGGTNPNFTVAVWMLGMPRSNLFAQ